MTKLVIETIEKDVLEIGQIRKDRYDRMVLIVETGDAEMSDEIYNAIHLDGENIYQSVYIASVSSEKIMYDFPIFKNVKQIKIELQGEIKE